MFSYVIVSTFSFRFCLIFFFIAQYAFNTSGHSLRFPISTTVISHSLRPHSRLLSPRRPNPPTDGLLFFSCSLLFFHFAFGLKIELFRAPKNTRRRVERKHHRDIDRKRRRGRRWPHWAGGNKRLMEKGWSTGLEGSGYWFSKWGGGETNEGHDLEYIYVKRKLLVGKHMERVGD